MITVETIKDFLKIHSYMYRSVMNIYNQYIPLLNVFIVHIVTCV